MSPPLALAEAWARLLALARPLGSESVAIDDAHGRYMAQSLAARRTQPSRDLSAMDGFAVAGDGPWRIVGESRAGSDYVGHLSSGQAVPISTGAACPPGTDAILIVEDAEVSGTKLAAVSPPSPAHIRRRGFDFREGEPVLEAGARMGPAQIAFARSAGHGAICVARRPRIAILECGDELVADPEQAGETRLPASNGAMVAAMCRGLVGDIQRIGPVADERAALVAALAQSTEADVIVTTAGASVGEHDHARGALAEWGAEIDFWKVAVRPGKPLLVARKGAQLVLGLPGNPASAYVTAFLFLLPLLRAMQGASAPLPQAMPMMLAGSLPAGGPRREFLRGHIADGRVESLPERDSSALRSLAAALVLIERPERCPAASSGDFVPTYWIGNG